MRKQMVFLIGVLLIAPLFLVSIPDRDAPALHEVANSDHAALETRFNESEIVSRQPVSEFCRQRRLLASNGQKR